MRVDLIPTRSDNYVFVISDSTSNEACVVDPSDFVPVHQFLQKRHLILKKILVTHHHPDHVDGIEALKSTYSCEVVGSQLDNHRIPAVDTWVAEGDLVNFKTHEAKVIEVPGHTLGHIAYHFEDEQVLFSADTLFSVGCGRLFEGTPKMMMETLNRLARLPENTTVYCSHEYTLANLEFALSLEPDNKALLDFKQACEQKRAHQQPTVPTTIGIEKKLNPFLRVHEPQIKAAAGLPDGDLVDVFAEVRRRKDHF